MLVCVAIGTRGDKARCGVQAVPNLEYFWHAYFYDREFEKHDRKIVGTAVSVNNGRNPTK